MQAHKLIQAGVKAAAGLTCGYVGALATIFTIVNPNRTALVGATGVGLLGSSAILLKQSYHDVIDSARSES